MADQNQQGHALEAETADDSTRHVYTHPSLVEHWRHLVEIVTLTVAACWGLYVFVYQERIKPASEAADVLHRKRSTRRYRCRERVRRRRDDVEKYRRRWRATRRLRAQRLWAKVFTRTCRHARASKIGGFASRQLSNSAHTSAHDESEDTLLQTVWQPWRPLGGSQLGKMLSGVALSNSLTFVISRGKYDTVYAEWVWCVRRADDTRTVTAHAVHAPDGSYDILAFRRQELESANRAPCSTSVSESPI